MEDVQGFPCNKCGFCCKKIASCGIETGLDRGDGVCKHLNANNLCSIYENRPYFCRIDDYYNEYKNFLTREEYNQINIQYCKSFQARKEI
jgi:hypothetical protein